MARDAEEFRRQLLEQLGAIGMSMAKRAVGSRALRDAMRFEVLSPEHGRIFVPHFWAIYHHDGRGPVFPVRRRFLVWFVDPKDDPRLRDGYPVRVSDIRRLTRAEFIDGLERNKEMRRRNPGGGEEQFMRVREVSGPTAARKAYPFFTKGMAAFPALAARIVRQNMNNFVSRIAVTEKSSVTLPL